MQREFTYINDELCLSVDAVVRALGVEYNIGLGMVKQRLAEWRKRTRRTWRCYKAKGKNWVAYTGLPEETRIKIDYMYSDVALRYCFEELVSQARTLINDEDIAWFQQEYPYTVKQATDLSEACGWCRLLSNDVQTILNGYFPNKKTLFEISAKAVSGRKLYGFKVSNARVLGRKVKQFGEEGRGSLLSKKLGNNNARKGTEMRALMEKRIIHLYASALNPDLVIITRIFNQEAIERNWEALSLPTVRRIVRHPKHAVMIAAARNGINSARNDHEFHIKRAKPSRPDQLWSFDGTTVQLYNQSSKDGKAIKSWYIVYVSDAASGCIIGHGIGKTENSTVILSSLRKALTFGMYKPDFFQYDNHSANKGKEVQSVIERLGRVGIPSQPYNGKGKYVERVIGVIEQTVMRHFPNFVGGNITSRSKNSKANPDYLQFQVKNGELPSDAEVLEQVALAINVFNHTADKKGVTPIEKYRKEHPDRKRINALTLASAFWVKRSRTIRYNPEGIRMEVEGENYYYEVYSEEGVTDTNFRKYHGGESFIVRYDPDDLSKVNLYDKSDSWVATAEQKYEYSPTPKGRAAGEAARLLLELNNRKEMVDDAMVELEELKEEMAAEGLQEVSFQLVHKDALNRINGENELQLLETTGVVRKKVRVFEDDEAANRLLNDE